MLYFDYSSTTPISNQCLSAYCSYAKQAFANTNSLHTYGLEAAVNLESIRTQFSSLIGLKSDEIYFTGSGSEANFLAIVSLALAYKRKGKHILSTKTEHPSVLNALSYLEKQGYCITYMPVTKEGTVTVDALVDSIKPDTILCTIAAASSEIGTIQPIVELSTILRKHDILFHSDCIQALAKVPIDYTLLDAASFSAHKLYAPKGTGAAFISNRLYFQPFYEDTRHEKGFRPGTVDLPAIAAFTLGLEHAIQVQDSVMTRLSKYRKKVYSKLMNTGKFTLIGSIENRLPFHMGLLVHGWSGQQFMLECDRAGIALAIGSACRAGQTDIPESLKAIGLSLEKADQYVRLTFGEPTTENEIDFLIETLIKIACR